MKHSHKQQNKLYLLIGLLAAAQLIYAPVCHADIPLEKAKRLLYVSGFKQKTTILLTNTLMEQQTDNNFSAPLKNNTIASKHIEHYAKQITNNTLLAIHQELNQDEIDHLIKWFESSLGTRILATEIRSTKTAAHKHMQQIIPRLSKMTYLLSYVQLFDELSLTSFTEKKIHQTLNHQLTNRHQPQKKRTLDISNFDNTFNTPEKINAGIENIQGKLLLRWLYSYRNFRIEDLDKYEQFLRSAQAIKFHSLISTSLIQTLNKQSTNNVKKSAQRTQHSRTIDAS